MSWCDKKHKSLNIFNKKDEISLAKIGFVISISALS